MLLWTLRLHMVVGTLGILLGWLPTIAADPTLKEKFESGIAERFLAVTGFNAVNDSLSRLRAQYFQRNRGPRASPSESNTVPFTHIPGATQTAQYAKSYKKWLQNVKHNYDGFIRPAFGADPVMVTVSMYIMAFRSVSEVTMDYSMEIYFRQSWIDRRLAYNASLFGGRKEIELDANARSLLWAPDTNLVNAISTVDPKEGSMSHIELIRITPEGRVFQSKRITVTAECPMDLRKYPFDVQICRMYISSYGFRTSDIFYEWDQYKDIEVSSSTQLPDFRLTRFGTKAYNATYKTGTFSTIVACFVFQRNAGYCVVQLLFPANILIAACWISLFMENEVMFSDVMAVMLAILFLSYSYNSVMPKVSYIKGMDIYLGVCLVFSFLALVKMAILKPLKHLAKKRDEELNRGRSLHRFDDLASTTFVGLLAATMVSGFQVDRRNLQKEADNTDDADNARNTDDASNVNVFNLSEQERQQRQLAQVLRQRSVHKKKIRSRIWWVMKVFHYGTQLLLPAGFIKFCYFFFFKYPSMVSAAEDEC